MSVINFVALCESVLVEETLLRENLFLICETRYPELLRISAEAKQANTLRKLATTPEAKAQHVDTLKTLQKELLDELNREELATPSRKEQIRSFQHFEFMIDKLAFTIDSKLEGLAHLKPSLVENDKLRLADNTSFNQQDALDWIMKKVKEITASKKKLDNTLLGTRRI